MGGTLVFEIALILVLMVANGFFAASEIAVVSARRGRLEQRAERGEHGAAVALGLAESPNRFLSTVQVGITVISTLAAAFGGASLAEAIAEPLMPLLGASAPSVALAIVVVLISYFSLIIGELVPKRLALQNAEGIAATVAPIMRTMARLTSPVVSFLTFSTELVLRLLGRHGVEETPITEDDVIALAQEGAEEGTVEETEKELITSIFTFTDRRVRSVMTPRPQLVAVSIDAPFASILRIASQSGYSRLPVYQETLDNIIGILFVKELLRMWGQAEGGDLRTLLHPTFYVPESLRAVVALQQLKRHDAEMAVALDEYGQVAGLVTVEDMLDEIVGDIVEPGDGDDPAIVRRADGSYLVDGLLPYVEVQERLGLPGTEGLEQGQDFTTLAGLLLVLLGRFPHAGDTVTWHDYTLEVVDMDGQRIDKVLIRPPTQPEAQTEGLLAQRAVILPPVPPTDQMTR
jgi:putative hemolysin